MIKQVLDVGGHDRSIHLPAQYSGWKRIILDIDSEFKPDIVLDARKLCDELQPYQYDGVYCSHNLEHYYAHDVKKVLNGFYYVLKKDGFIHIRVPDLTALMQRVVRENLDLDDVLYHAPIGDVRVKDVIYGYAPKVEASCNDYYAHKTGFSTKTLAHAIKDSGFKPVFIATTHLEIRAIAFKGVVSDYVLKNFNLKPKNNFVKKLNHELQKRKDMIGTI